MLRLKSISEKILIIAIGVTMTAINIMPTAATAEEETLHTSVTVPISWTMDSNATIKCDGIFTLTADDDSFPAPSDAKGQTETITMEEPGDAEFSEIEFDEDGFYSYTVARETDEEFLQEGYERDISCYEVYVNVENGQAEVTYLLDGNEVDNIVYSDIYRETEPYQGMTMMRTVLRAGDTMPDELSVKFNNTGKKYWYDDDRVFTIYKEITYKHGGKTYERPAYCLEPVKAGGDTGKYTAKKIGNNSDLRKVLWFDKGAPGYKKLKKYIESQGNDFEFLLNNKAFYCEMHTLAAYAFDNDYDWKAPGKDYAYISLTKGYKNKTKQIYKWIMKQDTPRGGAFEVEEINNGSHNVTADYIPGRNVYSSKDHPFKITGDSVQYFEYTVPQNAKIYIKRSGTDKYDEVHKEGKKIELHHGDRFYFEFDGTVTKGISETVTGELSGAVAYKINMKSSYQDIAFFAMAVDYQASFSVSIDSIDYGKFWIKKLRRKVGGSTSPESGVKFYAYKATYSSYTAAKAASTSQNPMATIVTTSSDGTATSDWLSGGTYILHQDPGSTPAGVEVAADITFTLPSDGKTHKVGSTGIIYNNQIPLEITVQKKDSADNSLISSPAVFGIFKDKECTDRVQQITTSQGVATSEHLDPGTYYIKELTPPAGYDINETVKKVNVTYSGAVFDNSDDVFYYDSGVVSDTRSVFHNLRIIKAVQGNPVSPQFTFTVSFRDLEPNTVYNYTKGASNLSFTSENDGTAELEFIMTDGMSVEFINLPSKSKYKISEAVASDVKPSFSVTENEEATVVDQSTSSQGEDIETPWEGFPADATNSSYRVGYTFVNSAEKTADVSLTKSVLGTEDNGYFRFHVLLSSLQSNGTSYIIPAYTITEIGQDGNERTVTSQVATTSQTPIHNFNIALKANQTLKLLNMPAGTAYRFVEYQYGKYDPGFTIYKNGTAFQTGTTDTGVITTNPTETAEYAIEWTNEVESVPTSTLEIEKYANPDDEVEFEYTLNLENAGDATYALFKRNSGATITVTNQASGAYPFTTSEGYIPYNIIRSDGEYFSCTTNASGQPVDVISPAIIEWAGLTGSETSATVIIDMFGERFHVAYTVASESESGGILSRTYAASMTEATFDIIGYEVIDHIETVSGSASIDFILLSGEKVMVAGLPKGASYTVKETGTYYEPSYEITRTMASTLETRMLKKASGGATMDITTSKQTFPDASVIDKVSFLNTQDVANLRVNKTVENGDTNKPFTFDFEFSGLTGDQIEVVRPGNYTYTIETNSSGDIVLSATNGGNVEGINITITNPEGVAHQYVTDENGVVPLEDYGSWLFGGRTSPFTFTLEVLGSTFEL